MFLICTAQKASHFSAFLKKSNECGNESYDPTRQLYISKQRQKINNKCNNAYCYRKQIILHNHIGKEYHPNAPLMSVGKWFILVD